jgi:hypothetical protein
MVHKVEEYKERVFSGSEASQAMSTIRSREPTFDMNIFLKSIKVRRGRRAGAASGGGESRKQR